MMFYKLNCFQKYLILPYIIFPCTIPKTVVDILNLKYNCFWALHLSTSTVFLVFRALCSPCWDEIVLTKYELFKYHIGILNILYRKQILSHNFIEAWNVFDHWFYRFQYHQKAEIHPGYLSMAEIVRSFVMVTGKRCSCKPTFTTTAQLGLDIFY